MISVTDWLLHLETCPFFGMMAWFVPFFKRNTSLIARGGVRLACVRSKIFDMRILGKHMPPGWAY
jgi:hypothetical protein